MIEAYAFFAMFPLQILAVSVLYPAWFIRYVRVQATSIPAERLALLYPGVDVENNCLAAYHGKCSRSMPSCPRCEGQTAIILWPVSGSQ
jgi:hypothetical protein